MPTKPVTNTVGKLLADASQHQSRVCRAPRGNQLTCKTWQAEAAMRMLMNNLDPEVAERPEDLVVYGGRGQAARSWPAFDAIVKTLERLEPDETLLVQSGKPVGVVKTHADAPRVLIANSNLVPHWATQKHFDELAAKGLIMYGQMTAGSWIYIGTQGIVQGTYETFRELAQHHYKSDLAGKLNVTAGCGGMGGAQPLAITMNGGTCLIADIDPRCLQRRVKDRYLDQTVEGIDAAIDAALQAAKAKKAISIGVCCNAVDLLERLLERNITPDTLTDQTSAHDVLHYVPAGMSIAQAEQARSADAAHLPAWQAFNKAVGSNGDVGIWHETYVIKPGGYESVYNNMPPFGLGAAGRLVEAKGHRKAARQRLTGATEAAD